MSIKEPKNLLPGPHFKGTVWREGGIIEQTERVYWCVRAFRGWFSVVSGFWGHLKKINKLRLCSHYVEVTWLWQRSATFCAPWQMQQ